MSRNDIIREVGSLIDAIRPRCSNPRDHALLGDAERYCNRLTDHSRSRLITLRHAQIALTVLRLRASRINAYRFRRRPSQRWISRYGNWPI